MTWKDKTGVAWSNLGRRKARTALTSMGVVVGITTVVTMVSLVNGVQQQVKQQFEKIGLDRVVVQPQTTGGLGDFGGGFGGFSGGFDPFGTSKRTQIIAPADVKRWNAWPQVQKATPEINLPGGLASGLQLRGKVVAVRIGSDSSPRRGPFAEAPDALAGSLDLPDSRGSVVVSEGVLKNLKVPKSEFKSLIGQSATIILATPRGERQSYALKISGIASGGGRLVQVSTPERLAMKGWWLNDPNLLKKEGYDSVTLRTADVSQAKILVGKLRQEKLNVQSIDAILDVANRIFSVITAMLTLVSSVALLVACIGIVNTMIMSIYERTREIGTLKAMGASRNDIRHMFMMEAGLIGLLGGVMGLLFSWILGRALNALAIVLARQRDFPLPDQLFIITPMLAVQALGFAFLIGMLAGLYPANRAARLDPLMALRHE